jgi:ribosome-binding protein aMBF1 (putative translation factor)
MDIEAIKAQARLLEEKAREAREQPAFQNVLAWLTYLGLLRHNRVEKRRVEVPLHNVLQAGVLEPRILEILPAIMVCIPEALIFRDKDVPEDLRAVTKAIRERKALAPFRGVPAQAYLHWLKSALMDDAKKRLHFRSLPRNRGEASTKFSAAVRNGRMARLLTQKEMAEKFGLSLRVIRDLEQGKLTASIDNAAKVLAALDRKLTVL